MKKVNEKQQRKNKIDNNKKFINRNIKNKILKNKKDVFKIAEILNRPYE